MNVGTIRINMNEQEVKKAVGSIIKKYRKNMKLTQLALGETVSINQRQVALIEAGKSFPSLSTMVKLVQVFQCRLEDLFKFENQEHKNLYSHMKSFIKTCSTDELKQLCDYTKSFK